MTTRREFIIRAGALAAGTMLFQCNVGGSKEKNLGLQLYTFRKEMDEDPLGTLKQIAGIGIKQIESARSAKGHYYGLTPSEMKKACSDLGMTLRSGHVHVDENWQRTLEEAVESGQEYVICSTMPTEGQTVDNYKSVAEAFNKAGEECKKLNLKFGYHNHEYEFEADNGQILYDVLLNNCQADLVHMELDLGWVLVGGQNPLDYFKRYEGRFPLWHLKDMNMSKKESTEFGKGGLDIAAMLAAKEQAGVKYIFIEQEEYATTPLESMRHNMEYLDRL
ncbi:MAG TPA: sugar phosphate isomerase/epimerase [Cyclobacteriaceae bacterium]|nr:sugar phosphate isomerase/epimerase [Cyclobacteriaceae bacterium]